ncbi:hypothetical protein [Silvimonas iriomotensis]|nr:hypothetical protein [Silvimonas iriomotensis]
MTHRLLSEEEYQTLLGDMTILRGALGLETKYQYLIRNYATFERELFDCTLDSVLFEKNEYASFHEIKVRLNLALANFLSTARLYLDQAHRDIQPALADPKEAARLLKHFRTEQYDSHFAYRFMEALRNHVQHNGSAIHLTTKTVEWVRVKNEEVMEQRTIIQTTRQSLAEDGKFKAEVLDEMDDQVDLRRSVRQYVECLSDIQASMRSVIKDAVLQAETHLQQVIEAALEEKEGVVRVMKITDGNVDEDYALSLEYDKVRRVLQSESASLRNLPLMHISGR